MKQLAVFDGFNGLIHIVKGDFVQGAVDRDAAGASGDGDESRFFELSENFADDDGIGVDADGKKITGHLIIFLIGLHTGENVKGNRKPT